MRRIEWSPQDQESLASTFKMTPDRRLRDRCQAVLMASRGRRRPAIAQDLGVHRSTVLSWLKQYQVHGLAGLHIQWAPGKPRRIPEDLAPTIQGWVKGGPQHCGLDRANWTYEELAVYLYQQTGIEVKRSAMQDFCQRHDMRPYRPTYPYLRGDLEQQQVARHELDELKKKPKPAPVCCSVKMKPASLYLRPCGRRWVSKDIGPAWARGIIRTWFIVMPP